MEIERKIPVWLGLIAFMLVYGLAGNGDYQDALAQQEFYCENVKLYQESAGENGHPNYKELDCEGS